MANTTHLYSYGAQINERNHTNNSHSIMHMSCFIGHALNSSCTYLFISDILKSSNCDFTKKQKPMDRCKCWRTKSQWTISLRVLMYETTTGVLCTTKRTFCESICSANPTNISWRNTVSAKIQKKDAWCDMTHSVVDDQACVRLLLCNHITLKAICHREWGLDKGKVGQHSSTNTDWSGNKHNGFETHWTVADHWGMDWCGWQW